MRYSMRLLLGSLSRYQSSLRTFLCFSSTKNLWNICCMSPEIYEISEGHEAKCSYGLVQIRGRYSGKVLETVRTSQKRHESDLVFGMVHPAYWKVPTFFITCIWGSYFCMLAIKYTLHECHHVLEFHWILGQTSM